MILRRVKCLFLCVFHNESINNFNDINNELFHFSIIYYFILERKCNKRKRKLIYIFLDHLMLLKNLRRNVKYEQNEYYSSDS